MIQHAESSIKVFFTKEHSRFRMINGNRQLNESKIKRIVTDIENGIDVLKYCPILVKENGDTLDIIDGQHRFYVSRKLKTNVWYILSEGMSLHSIAKINSNTEKWNSKDFINCYCQLGNNNYICLRDLLDQFPLSVTDAVSMLTYGAPIRVSGAKEKFEQGLFEVKQEDKAKTFLSVVSKFSFKNKFTRNFLTAVHKVMEGEKIEIDELIAKVNSNSDELKVQVNYKDYLFNLESIFNKGKQTRKVIY
jgi:hypothetical protein